MVVFWLGMTAALLWVVVGYVFYTWFKARPPHPFRTVGRFRSTRRRLARSISPPAAPIEESQPPEVTEPLVVASLESQFEGAAPDGTAEILVIPDQAVQGEQDEGAAEGAPVPKPRRLGTLTYIVVDDEGVPEHPELLRS